MSAIKKIQDCGTEFALQLYLQLASSNDGNIFVSPYSISATMSMLLLGARENTAVELKRGLGFAEVPDTDVHSCGSEVHKQLVKPQKHVILDIANNLFLEKSCPFSLDFLEQCLKFYQSKVENLDFKENPETARIYINNWAQKQTRDKIKDLLPSGSVHPLVKLILANAVYFKGSWSDKFNEKDTIECDFYIKEGETRKVKMMNQKGKYKVNFHEELGVQVVEVPYKGNDMSMIILLPTERFGLANLQKRLTKENFTSLISELREQEIILSLPKMKLEHKVDLIPILSNLGIRDVFDESKANLKGISVVPNLFVSGVFHKTYIEVNEEGSEAAAATAVVIMPMCIQLPPVRVNCDHPFMFIIRHNLSQTTLFMGSCISP